jgi:alkyldihydroxyacetonephosphate synthase
MNRMLWINEKSMLACFESGISFKQLEEFLKSKGLTTGFEKESIEFFTLGGLIASKSSIAKNEIQAVRFATSVGVLELNSTSPNLEKIIIGSEGTFGVITEVVIKIYKVPKNSKFGSLLFPDSSCGLKFLQKCAQNNLDVDLKLFCNLNIQAGKFLKIFHSKLKNN